MDKIKLMLADDHILVRNSMALLINMFGKYEIIGLAANGKEVIQHLEKGNIPELLILDLNMPVMDGFQTAKILHEKYPEINIIILTMFDSEVAFIRLLRLGVKGFLPKDINDAVLEEALGEVANSQYYYFGDELNRLAKPAAKEKGKRITPKHLPKDIEMEFLRLTASDLTYKEIADKMSISMRKADHLRDILFGKLNVKSRVGLAMYAAENGLVFLDN